MILSLLDAFNDVLVQPFMSNGAVVAFDIGVLLRLTGLDVLYGNPMFLGPFHQFFADVFGAVVDPYGAGLATPFDDAVEAPYDALGWQREVDLDPQAFPIKVVQHVQQPECPAISETRDGPVTFFQGLPSTNPPACSGPHTSA